MVATAVRLYVAALLVCAAGYAEPALADALSVPGSLKAGARLSCLPATKVFCANVHVSCAGRTTIPTFEFGLERVSGDSDRARLNAHETPTDFEKLPARTHKLTWGRHDNYALIRFADGRGYVKVFARGRFALRLYAAGNAMMTYGECSTPMQ